MQLLEGYGNKKRLLIAGALLFVILCWKFAFRKTTDAIQLHGQLTRQAAERGSLTVNPAFLNDRLRKMNLLFGRYRVDSAQWYDQFWMSVSSIAASKNAGIIYDPFAVAGRTDSSRQVARQSVQLRGSFPALVAILDTLEHSPGIGKVSRIIIKAASGHTGSSANDKPLMEIQFSALFKEK